MRPNCRHAAPCSPARRSVALAAAWLAMSVSAETAPPPPGATPAAAPAPAAAPPALPSDQLLNTRNPLPGVRTGGVPPAAEVYGRLAAEGFVTFVDLRPEPELSAAARAGAEAAGMTYVQIPVGSDADLDLATARALDAILDDPARRPVALACASGNRSAALLAVHAFWFDGESAEAALALGQAAGLTKLEPSVRRLLGLPAPPPAEPVAPAPPPSPPN